MIPPGVVHGFRFEPGTDGLGLSTPRLNRLARAESGCSALELVHERLTREACRRLVYIAAPVANVAEELGFADPAYFSRFFKRRIGMNPHRWRQAQLSEPVHAPVVSQVPA